ncbi:MAG: cytidine deaminase [Cyanophyceae cyanobacterium]
MIQITREEKAQLLETARSALTKAYAPYSNFRVGAALLTEQGNLYAGCNIENSSYGLTLCAERSAIASAIVSEGSAMKIRAIAIVNASQVACSPCGACRQVIAEFGADAVILFQGEQAILEKSIKDLLPAAFVL